MFIVFIQYSKPFDLPVLLFEHGIGGLVITRAIQELNLDISYVILPYPCLGITVSNKQINKIAKVSNTVDPELQLKNITNPELCKNIKEIHTDNDR